MLLQVEELVTAFKSDQAKIYALDGVSFGIKRGQTVGLVGESGCGKSVTSLSIMRLIEGPAGSIEAGKILFNDQNLLALSREEMRRIRGNQISMIFQDPMTSLNPVFTIGNQISEVFRIHQGATRKQAREKAIEMLRLVKIPAPEMRIDDYPHQLSGGMRQRVMIAMALACRPQLLIADEPTTALDVTIQAQVLELMAELQRELGMAILLITHDLGVIAEVCDYVLVMYAGKIIEQGPTQAIFTNPKHPYTVALLESIPRLGRRVEWLPTIGGMVPSLKKLPTGCRFHNRCPQVMERCQKEAPAVTYFSHDHQAACWQWSSRG